LTLAFDLAFDLAVDLALASDFDLHAATNALRSTFVYLSVLRG
jgi:hypothetical protein